MYKALILGLGLHLCAGPVLASTEFCGPLKRQSADLSAKTKTRLDQMLKAATTRWPGITLSVISLSRNGSKQVYSEVAGKRGVDGDQSNLPVEKNSLFRVVSISKSVTAIALKTLMKQNHFDWNTRLWDVPSHLRSTLLELDKRGALVDAEAWKSVTLGELATHTSGMFYEYMDDGLVRSQGRAPNEAEYLPRLSSTNYFPLARGSFTYVNEDYNVLALLAGSLSGEQSSDGYSRFQNYALGTVLSAVVGDGEIRYNFPRDQQEFGARVARGYVSLAAPSPVLYEPNHYSGSAGISMSATGLTNYVTEILKLAQGQPAALPIGKSDLHELLEPQFEFNVGLGRMVYGKGFYWQKLNGVLSFNHLGIDRYYTAEMAYYPEDGIAITAMTNIGNVVPGLRAFVLRAHDIVVDEIRSQREFDPDQELLRLARKADQLLK